MINQEQSEEANEQEQVTKTRIDVRKTNNNTEQKIPKVLIAVGLAVVILFAGMLYIQQNKQASSGVVNDYALSSENANAVVAVVNGENIMQEMLDQRLSVATQQLVAQGVDVTDDIIRQDILSQIREDVINYTLLRQNAKASDIGPDEEKLTELLQGYIDQAGSQEQFEKQLQQAGLIEDIFKERIREQILVDTYIAQNVDVDTVVVSDKEIQTFYDTAIAGNPEGAPPLEEVRQQISLQLTQQKQQDLILVFTDILRESATIEVK